jgi:hypothetical protein
MCKNSPNLVTLLRRMKKKGSEPSEKEQKEIESRNNTR